MTDRASKGVWTRALDALEAVGIIAHKAAPPEAPKPANYVFDAVPTWGTRYSTPEWDLRNLVDEGYRRNVVAYVCVQEIASSASEPNLVARRAENKEPVPDDHPLQKLLNKPHPDLDRFTLFEQAFVHLLVTGDAYIHKGRNAAGEVIQLKPLRPDRMEVVPDRITGAVLGWDYRVIGRPDQFIPRRDIMRLSLPDPLNDYYGLPPLMVAAKFADLDQEAAQYLRDFFVNGAMPLGLLKLKYQADRTERERVQMAWKENYGRASRGRDQSAWWNIAVINALDVDYEQLSTDPNKLNLSALWGLTETRICAAFKTPPILVQVKVGIDSSTYSNYAEARVSFWQETLAPLYEKAGMACTQDLASEWEEGLEVVFDLTDVKALQEGEDAKSTRLLKQFAGGVLRRNEVREELGIEPLKTDVIVLPTGAVEVEKDGTQVEKPIPPALAPFAKPEGEVPPPKGGKPPKPPEEEPEEEPEETPPKPKRRPRERALERRDPQEVLAEVDGEVADRISTQSEGVLAAKLLRVLQGAQRNVEAADLIEALKDRDVGAAEVAVRLEVLRDRLRETLTGELQPVLRRVADAVLAAVTEEHWQEAPAETLALADDLKAWVMRHVASEVNRTHKDGRLAIREAILRAIQNDRDAASAAAEIQSHVGLNRVQSGALQKMADRLREKGESPATIRTEVERYSGRLLTQRAEMIAATELKATASEAQRMAWDALAESGVIEADEWIKVWVTARRNVCPVCYELDGEEAPLDGTFGDEGFYAPPEPHPNCHCRIVTVKKEGKGKRKWRRQSEAQANPYHDKVGRFAPAGSGGGAGGGEAAFVQEHKARVSKVASNPDAIVHVADPHRSKRAFRFSHSSGGIAVAHVSTAFSASGSDVVKVGVGRDAEAALKLAFNYRPTRPSRHDGLEEETLANPYHDKVGRFAPKGGKGGGAAAGEGGSKTTVKAKPNERALKAKASYKPSTRAVQTKANGESRKLAADLGMTHTPDNAAFDIVGPKHVIEVKALIKNKNDKITMHPSSRRRKEADAKKQQGKRVWTIGVETRAGRGGGYYYKEGVGAFRIANMKRAKTLGELKRGIGA